jgi:hypothetical protein
MQTRAILTLGAALAMIFSLAGCSGSERVVEVKGKVHQNGQPLPVQELPSGAGGRVMVRFYFLEENQKSQTFYAAIVKSNGTFSVPGNSGKGIPPGKYRVAITWQDTFPMGVDNLKGKFGKDNSPLVVDIPHPDEIDINVAGDTGGR